VLLSVFPSLKDGDHIGHLPELGRDASGHCRADFERLVDAHKIVVHEVEGHHVRVVLRLFRKGVGEPRHAAVAHADIEVLPLGK